MENVSGRVRRTRWIVLSAFVLSLLGWAQNAPTVSKVEPPNWWTGLEPSNVMVMLTGTNLGGAQISVSHAGVKVTRIQVQPNGTYAFVWMQIASTAAPG